MPYWVLWVIWLGSFFALEVPAVKRRQGETLSEYVWRAFSIGFQGRGWRARRIMLLAFLSWLVAHFLTGGLV